MSDDTGIEWTHVPGYRGATWNPVRGCTKISPGCKHCYAETTAERWRGVIMPNGKPSPYFQGFDLRLVPEKLDEPLRKRDPRAYFVNSMSDLFQDAVSDSFIAATFGVMAASPRHVFMTLTKRAGRQLEWMMRRNAIGKMAAQSGQIYDPRAWTCMHEAAALLPNSHPFGGTGVWPLPNVWLGVSVEDRKYGLPRIDILRETPAAVRFLSVEPLLEDLGEIDLRGIHWVVVGGESGPGARVCDLAWIRRVVGQCKAQGVPVFVKQLGADPRDGVGRRDDVSDLVTIKSRKGGDLQDLPPDLRIREFPKAVS